MPINNCAKLNDIVIQKLLKLITPLYLSYYRTCHTRTTIGTSSASSVSNARRRSLTSHSHPRMTASSAPIAMTTSSPPGVMAAHNHSGEVSGHHRVVFRNSDVQP